MIISGGEDRRYKVGAVILLLQCVVNYIFLNCFVVKITMKMEAHQSNFLAVNLKSRLISKELILQTMNVKFIAFVHGASHFSASLDTRPSFDRDNIT